MYFILFLVKKTPGNPKIWIINYKFKNSYNKPWNLTIIKTSSMCCNSHIPLELTDKTGKSQNHTH